MPRACQRVFRARRHDRLFGVAVLALSRASSRCSFFTRCASDGSSAIGRNPSARNRRLSKAVSRFRSNRLFSIACQAPGCSFFIALWSATCRRRNSSRMILAAARSLMRQRSLSAAEVYVPARRVCGRCFESSRSLVGTTGCAALTSLHRPSERRRCHRRKRISSREVHWLSLGLATKECEQRRV